MVNSTIRNKDRGEGPTVEVTVARATCGRMLGDIEAHDLLAVVRQN